MVLTIEHADGERERLETTKDHPFWSVNADDWVVVGELGVGDGLATLGGMAEIAGIEYRDELTTVYNLTIPGSPTYFVGERGVWVHNCDLAPNFPLGFSRVRRSGQSTFEHVQGHASNSITKTRHGVFDNDPVLATQEAWSRIQREGITGIPSGQSRFVFQINMGRRVGWHGGAAGQRPRSPLNSIRIIVDSTDELITAFPF